MGVVWETREELGSDHWPCISIIQESYIPGKEDQEQFIIPQLNWNELKKRIRGFCQQRAKDPDPLEDIPELLEVIKSIPKTQRRYKNPCRWWDQHLAQLKERRNQARKAEEWNTFKEANKGFKRAFYKKKRQYFADLVSQISREQNPWKSL